MTMPEYELNEDMVLVPRSLVIKMLSLLSEMDYENGSVHPADFLETFVYLYPLEEWPDSIRRELLAMRVFKLNKREFPEIHWNQQGMWNPENPQLPEPGCFSVRVYTTNKKYRDKEAIRKEIDIDLLHPDWEEYFYIHKGKVSLLLTPYGYLKYVRPDLLPEEHE